MCIRDSDCTGNSETASQTIKQVDTGKPTITGVGPNGSVECPVDPTTAFSSPSASDTCDANVSLTHKDVTNQLACGISVTRTWTATDCTGNSETASQTIKQVDTGKPTITGVGPNGSCLLYTSDAADERSSVDLGGRRIIKKKKNKEQTNQLACGISVFFSSRRRHTSCSGVSWARRCV